MFWSQESHRQQNEIGADDFFASWDLGHVHFSVLEFPRDPDGLDTRNVTVAIIDELFAEDVVDPRV